MLCAVNIPNCHWHMHALEKKITLFSSIEMKCSLLAFLLSFDLVRFKNPVYLYTNYDLNAWFMYKCVFYFFSTVLFVFYQVASFINLYFKVMSFFLFL